VSTNQTTSSPAADVRTADSAGGPPPVLRFGAFVVLAQCLALFGYAVWLIVTNLRGVADSSIESQSGAADYVGIGTALFILVVFGFVAYTAVRLLRGAAVGSGAIVLVELILAAVAFYMFGGGARLLGAATLVSAVLALVGIFHPASWAYARTAYARRTAS